MHFAISFHSEVSVQNLSRLYPSSMTPRQHDPPQVAFTYGFQHIPRYFRLFKIASFRDPFKTPLPDNATVNVVAPPSDAHLDEYLRWCGAPKGAYRDTIPPHLFLLWSLDTIAAVVVELPYSVAGLLNQGCKLTCNSQIRRGMELHTAARVKETRETGGKVRITIEVRTGPVHDTSAVVAEVHLVTVNSKVKKEKRDDSSRAGTGRSSLPPGTETLATHRLSERAGIDCSHVTGDYNPIHVLPFAARLSGFKNVIMQGFGTFALAFEDIVHSECGGQPHFLHELDARFVGNVVLPTTLHVSIDRVDQQVFAGRGPGTEPAMVGTYSVMRHRSNL